MPLDDATRAKLGKIMRMLGSDHAGERAAAAAKADALLRAAGTTWAEIAQMMSVILSAKTGAHNAYSPPPPPLQGQTLDGCRRQIGMADQAYGGVRAV